MTHIETLLLFVEMFHIKNEIEGWWPNGQNSVRIRLKESSMLPFDIPRVDLVFTAIGRDEWRLETVISFINNELKKDDQNVSL